MLKKMVIAAVLGALSLAGSLDAQQPAPIKRTPLQKTDVPGAGYETITGIAEIAPNVNIGRHTHFGPEMGYLMEGTLTLLVDGKPPVVLNPGDSYQIPPGTPHDARSGDRVAKVLAVYVVEKGKPLATPAP